MMLDWLLPPRCAGCGQAGARWCRACIERCQLIRPDVCSLCGKTRNPQNDRHRCTRKQYLDEVYAWAKYSNPVQKAIRRLKYSRDVALGDALAQHLIWLVERHQLKGQMVVPVPLARKRRQERGYNQSVLLGRSLAWKLGLDFQPRALARIRETSSQVGLSLEERQKNVEGAFRADQARVAGQPILLVDDVLTTGATLEAAAQALKEAGAANVDAVVVSRA